MRSSGGVVSSGLQHSPPPASAGAAASAGVAGAAASAGAAGAAGWAGADWSAAGSSVAQAFQAKAPMPATTTSVRIPVVILCTFGFLALAGVVVGRCTQSKPNGDNANRDAAIAAANWCGIFAH